MKVGVYFQSLDFISPKTHCLDNLRDRDNSQKRGQTGTKKIVKKERNVKNEISKT